LAYLKVGSFLLDCITTWVVVHAVCQEGYAGGRGRHRSLEMEGFRFAEWVTHHE
jgi:hypothetical protein